MNLLKRTKRLGLLIIPLLFSLVTINQPLNVNAASRPSNINMSMLDDNAVNNYYVGVQNKSGDDLLGVLNTIIKGHDEYSYGSNPHREIYKITHRNWELSPLSEQQLQNYDYNDNPYIRKLYADYNDDPVKADRFKNDGASSVSFDKEHIWAQSLGNFGRTGGAGSDFHALWPSDVRGNQVGHSNYSFGVPTTGVVEVMGDLSVNTVKDNSAFTGTSVGRYGTNPSLGSNKVFEPLDEYKGDIARAMLYMPARYYTYESITHPKLTLVDATPGTNTASASNAGEAGHLATLLEWNKIDPPSAEEIKRNNLIHLNYQKNRNPFIDHPEWADIVYDTAYSGPGASIAPGSSSVGDGSGGQEPTTALLTHLTLDTTNAATNFSVNSPFTSNGLVVSAHFDDSTTQSVTNFTTNPSEGAILSTVGINTIAVSYTNETITKTATYPINVTNESLENNLVISEAYGGGGNVGSYYTHDFVELFNYGSLPINLNGMSVQWASAAGTTWTVTNLSNFILPQSYYLIQQAKGTGGDAALPEPDAIGTSAMGLKSFKVALVNSTTALSGNDPRSEPSVLDFLAAGTSLSNSATAPSNQNSVMRKSNVNLGYPNISTNNNAADFEIALPTPTNSALSVAQYLMASNFDQQCITRYPIAHARMGMLTGGVNGQLGYFRTNSSTIDARLRYEAWAAYLGTTPYDFSANSPKQIVNLHNNNQVFIIFGLLSLVMIASYLIIIRKRQYS